MVARRLIEWLLGRPEPTRLEALRILAQAEVITPPRKVIKFRNLLVVRGQRKVNAA